MKIGCEKSQPFLYYNMRMQKGIIAFFTVYFLLFSWGCSSSTQIPQKTSETNLTITVSLTPSVEATTIPPTETPVPVPVAAVVNGEGILLTDFEEEYLRYQDAIVKSGVELDEVVGKATVLENMIDVLLLAQNARENGFHLTDELFQERKNNLIAQLGDEQKLVTWKAENHYSEESFTRLYKIEIEAAFMRDSIMQAVPVTAEQIHAKQILVQSKALAEEIYTRLQSGADFATLAWIYDPITGGELSWFPRNYLVLKDVEDAVFLLNPGEYTTILPTDYGYQIVQVLEREKDRLLTQDALFTYQRRALKDWLQDKKQSSMITIENN